ncbi:hypothetical protein SARC_12648, partial [Sphaeroforma arctica JP610]
VIGDSSDITDSSDSTDSSDNTDSSDSTRESPYSIALEDPIWLIKIDVPDQFGARSHCPTPHGPRATGHGGHGAWNFERLPTPQAPGPRAAQAPEPQISESRVPE